MRLSTSPELSRQAWLAERAAVDECSLHEWALAALLAIDPNVVVIPGARRPETVASSRRALDVRLPDAAAMVLRRYVVKVSLSPAGERVGERGDASEVLLLMGLQGAGKTTAVSQSLAQGYQRLNRDEAKGTLARLHEKLGVMLRSGTQRVVLDNTYVTHEQRRGALEVAARHGVPVRGIWHEIELAQAQVNVVLRMLEVHGRLLGPEELKGKTPDTLGPLVLPRTVKTLEPPAEDEGFSSLTRVPFVRRPWPDGVPALFLGLDQLAGDGTWLPGAAKAIAEMPDAPRILLGWREGGMTVPDGVISAICPHPGGPPTCWCRPPLPGLVLERARALKLCISKSLFVTSAPALITLGRVLGVTPLPESSVSASR